MVAVFGTDADGRTVLETMVTAHGTLGRAK